MKYFKDNIITFSLLTATIATLLILIHLKMESSHYEQQERKSQIPTLLSSETMLETFRNFFYIKSKEQCHLRFDFVDSPKDQVPNPKKKQKPFEIDANTLVLCFVDKDSHKHPCVIKADQHFKFPCKLCFHDRAKEVSAYNQNQEDIFFDKDIEDYNFIGKKVAQVASTFSDAYAHKVQMETELTQIAPILRAYSIKYPKIYPKIQEFNNFLYAEYLASVKTHKKPIKKLDQSAKLAINMMAINKRESIILQEYYEKARGFLMKNVCPKVSKKSVDKASVELRELLNKKLLKVQQAAQKNFISARNQRIRVKSQLKILRYVSYCICVMALTGLALIFLRERKIKKMAKEKQIITAQECQKRLKAKRMQEEFQNQKCLIESLQKIRREFAKYNLTSPILNKENSSISKEEKSELKKILDKHEEKILTPIIQKSKIQKQIDYGVSRVPQVLNTDIRIAFQKQYEDIQKSVSSDEFQYKNIRKQIIDLNNALRKTIKSQ